MQPSNQPRMFSQNKLCITVTISTEIFLTVSELILFQVFSLYNNTCSCFYQESPAEKDFNFVIHFV